MPRLHPHEEHLIKSPGGHCLSGMHTVQPCQHASIASPRTDRTHITETSRIHLVLFGRQNRTFGPYVAAIQRILISVMMVGKRFPACRFLPYLVHRHLGQNVALVVSGAFVCEDVWDAEEGPGLGQTDRHTRKNISGRCSHKKNCFPCCYIYALIPTATSGDWCLLHPSHH
jgi:hypothetical protein